MTYPETSVQSMPASTLLSSMDIVLFGGPGSGKGTQAEQLSEYLKLPHVSTGDLFRENLEQETELGLLAQGYMSCGDLVPDSVTEAMVQERLTRGDTENGFILDGFPRTIHQAQALTKILTRLGRQLNMVLYINVPDEEIVMRLSGRLICHQCQTPFHRQFKPPQKEGICDLCGGTLYQRDDDQPETVRARLETFHTQTEPLLDYYQARNLLIKIDGQGAIATVTEQLLQAIDR